MKVGLIAFRHESNTFVRGVTGLDQFKAVCLLEGEPIRPHFVDSHNEMGGFLAGLAEQGIEAVPLVAADATPAGPVTRDAYDHVMGLILGQLQRCAGELDGLLLAPHGAGVAEHEPDMDGAWLAAVREAVGDAMPIVATMDPHANLSERMVAACDAMVAYHTNPHIDQRQVGMEAATLLGRQLRGEVKLTTAAAFPPVAMSIDRQQNDAEPCLSAHRQVEAVTRQAGVLSASLVLGFPYADVPEVGSAYVVVTDDNKTTARAHADALAGWLIEHQADYGCSLSEVEQAVRDALDHDSPVCLLDVGDNVGGGSAADGTTLARALDRALADRPNANAFISLFDPEAQQQARDAGVQARLALTMGGKSDDLHGKPFEAEVTVLSLHEGTFRETQPRHGGRQFYDMGPTAIVRTAHGLIIQLTSVRTCPFSLGQVTSCGLDPTMIDVLVAKGVNAPIAAYREVCDRFIRVNTPGTTCADMTKLPFQNRRKPLFPFETLPV